jgi:cytochrome oxidase assembly protein ShyY1
LLLTPRWIGLISATIVASIIMIFLGRWQWGRYELRTAINNRIDASASSTPAPFGDRAQEWTRVSLTGSYDPGQEILVRNRTVDGHVGFEVLTPLVQPSGEAVLVDRGWVPPDPSGITVSPKVGAAPPGTVTILGRVRAAESGGKVESRNGHWEARRVDIHALAAKLPYPVAPVYVLADDESTDLKPIPSQRENNWLNFGYAIQWWLFSAGVWFGLYWLARREQRMLSEGDVTQQERLGKAHSREFA